MAAKSPDAFRTISEVADWLDVPTHVLRFWESRFTQVKPVKRAGGRRYYRPSDMLLIGGIKKLLHEDGMTIRGVQKLLREEGVKHVAGHSRPLEFDLPDAVDGTVEDVAVAAPEPEAAPENLFASVDDAGEARVENAEEPQAESAVVSFRHRAVDIEPTAPAPAAPPTTHAPETPTAEPVAASRDEAPTLPFIGRASDHAAPAEPTPQITPTPNVPDVDPEDDAPAYATGPGIAARLVAGQFGDGLDPAVLRQVIEGLRAIRAA